MACHFFCNSMPMLKLELVHSQCLLWRKLLLYTIHSANTPPSITLLLAFVSFFLWSCLNSHLALPLSSSRSSTKQGAWGVFTHFPSPLSYTLITGLELLDNAESVASPHTHPKLLYLEAWLITSFKLHLLLTTFSSD